MTTLSTSEALSRPDIHTPFTSVRTITSPVPSATAKEAATAFSASSLGELHHKAVAIQNISIELPNCIFSISAILKFHKCKTSMLYFNFNDTTKLVKQLF